MDELREKISICCKELKLSSNFADKAFKMDGDTPQEYLLNLLSNEIETRAENRKIRYLNFAGFPRRYRKEEFSTDEVIFPEGTSFESLLNLDFYRAGKNIIMYGSSGTGKTMLSILIGMSACMQDIPVKFFRTAGLINEFSESKRSGSLSKLKKRLNRAEILILDEFGYVPYDRMGAQLLFDYLSEILILDEFGYVPYDRMGAQLLFDYLSEIHEQKSVILNTNLEFSQWVNVLYDQMMTTALIGRLTHHVDLILFPGVNHRLRESSINRALTKISDLQAGSNR